ncbi:hypothetical protein JTB14_024784 [Gonioctena quinquepunctata]|nr:hypothetical protein JTB14_024784 [Gonioctena quinquepunctata]
MLLIWVVRESGRVIDGIQHGTVKRSSVFTRKPRRDHAEEIDCNGLIIPSLYFIDNEWSRLAPYPTIKRAAMELGVAVPPKLNFSPIMPIGSAGLYTQEEINKVQKILTSGSERKAVENIARQVV